MLKGVEIWFVLCVELKDNGNKGPWTVHKYGTDGQKGGIDLNSASKECWKTIAAKVRI